MAAHRRPHGLAFLGLGQFDEDQVQARAQPQRDLSPHAVGQGLHRAKSQLADTHPRQQRRCQARQPGRRLKAAGQFVVAQQTGLAQR
ncbi:hypothetical protein D9M68_799170 [compost metagenome]